MLRFQRLASLSSSSTTPTAMWRRGVARGIKTVSDKWTGDLWSFTDPKEVQYTVDDPDYNAARAAHEAEERKWRASPNYKEGTSMCGVPVVRNAREVLIALYLRTLSDLEMLPRESCLRRNVEEITRHRLGVCMRNEIHQDIEDEVNTGEIESLIDQARDELKLIPLMAEAEPWVHDKEPSLDIDHNDYDWRYLDQAWRQGYRQETLQAQKEAQDKKYVEMAQERKLAEL